MATDIKEATATLDIVKLIEKNPITRLSKDYQNSLINKIKAKFTESQQQLFVSSFYCYLNHNNKNEFIVNLDNVWKWLGFSRKDPAKVVLNKNFIKDLDYKILLHQPMEQDENKHGGNNKETILMNINTFKKFCLKADTKKADEIHEYYIKLEELLHQTLDEETQELREQLTLKDKVIENNEKQNKYERHQLFINKFNNKRCVYIAEILENKYIKLGSTKDIVDRIKNFRRDYKNQNIIFLDVFECQNFREVEESILQDDIIRKNLYKGNIAGKSSKEIVEITDDLTLLDIQEIFEKYIKQDINLYTPEQLIEKAKLELENKKLEYNLLNNILNNDKYSKTIDDILKNSLTNIIDKISINLLPTQNAELNELKNKDNNNNNNNNQINIDNVPEKIPTSHLNFNSPSRKVLKIDPNDLTKIIKVYDSIIFAIRDRDNFGCTKPDMETAIRANRIYKGFRWVFVEKGIEPANCVINPTNKSLKRIIEPILELNSDKSKILNSYVNQTAMIDQLKISKGRIRKIIVNELTYNNKYYIELSKCPKELITAYNDKISYKKNHNAKSIKQINPTTKEVKIFNSLRDIESCYGFRNGTIINAINKKHLHGGFLWEFANKDLCN
jgi:hypothetical protein